MTTIAAQAGSDRTNKWLLIGGMALALMTGVLVFLAVTKADGGGGNSSSPAADGKPVLVAKENIAAGTRLSADMFRVATFAEGDLVPQALSDPQAVVGQTATVQLLQGQQLSSMNLASATADKRADQLAFKIPNGQRAVAIKVDETTAIGGNIVPGDRVDIVVRIDETEKATPNDLQFIRVRTVLQDVLVVAREQTGVDRVTTLPDAAATPAAGDTGAVGSQAFEQRPENVKPDAGLTTVSVALTPDQVQQLVLAAALGQITLVMRPFGDDQPVPLQDLRVPVVKD